MRINTTVPDDLGDRAKQLEINFSAVLREALERRINMIQTTQGLEEIELEDRAVAFHGKLVTRDPSGRCAYFVTAKENIVVHDEDELRMWTYSPDEFEQQEGVAPEVKSEILRELGRGFVEILDI